MAMEIGVAVEIGVGLGFVFTGLVVGGVFLGFCRGKWSVVEVEMVWPLRLVWPCLCFRDGDVSVSLVSCLWFFFFLVNVDLY